MTAVDRPDNGQGEGPWRVTNLVARDTGETLVTDGDLVVGYFHRRQDAERAVAAVNAGRAGAGEQQREQVARLLAEADQAHREFGTSCSCGYRVPADEQPVWLVAMQTHRYRVRADELLALLGGPQPDGEAEYTTARHGFGSPEYLAELNKLSAPPCPVYSHGDSGWHCAVTGDHAQHTNAAGDVTW